MITMKMTPEQRIEIIKENRDYVISIAPAVNQAGNGEGLFQAMIEMVTEKSFEFDFMYEKRKETLDIDAVIDLASEKIDASENENYYVGNGVTREDVEAQEFFEAHRAAQMNVYSRKFN